MQGMIFTLPTLPYDHAALEPAIDAETMHLHHVLHHQGYVDKLNAAMETLAAERPECIRALAEGAVMRLMAGARCFDAYRAHLWGQAPLRRSA